MSTTEYYLVNSLTEKCFKYEINWSLIVENENCLELFLLWDNIQILPWLKHKEIPSYPCQMSECAYPGTFYTTKDMIKIPWQ